MMAEGIVKPLADARGSDRSQSGDRGHVSMGRPASNTATILG